MYTKMLKPYVHATAKCLPERLSYHYIFNHLANAVNTESFKCSSNLSHMFVAYNLQNSLALLLHIHHLSRRIYKRMYINT